MRLEARPQASTDEAPVNAVSVRKCFRKTLIEFVRSVVGEPDYSFTLTLRPVHGARRRLTKIVDAEQAMDWFLHVLNTKCFGHGYRKKNLEVGIFAALEGIDGVGQPHWHGVIRVPSSVSAEKFFQAFDHAQSRTKRFGQQWCLEPYFEANWFEYITKSGMDSVQPRFLRQGAA